MSNLAPQPMLPPEPPQEATASSKRRAPDPIRIAAIFRSLVLQRSRVATPSCASVSEYPTTTTAPCAPKIVIGAFFDGTRRNDVDAAPILVNRCDGNDSSFTTDNIAPLTRAHSSPEHSTKPAGLIIRTIAKQGGPESSGGNATGEEL
jgi:hypothetical protein